jgi:hypothetical protein
MWWRGAMTRDWFRANGTAQKLIAPKRLACASARAARRALTLALLVLGFSFRRAALFPCP